MLLFRTGPGSYCVAGSSIFGLWAFGPFSESDNYVSFTDPVNLPVIGLFSGTLAGEKEKKLHIKHSH